MPDTANAKLGATTLIRQVHLDGVYVRGDPGREDSSLVFRRLPTPTRAETSEIARRIADRVETLLEKHGRSLDPDEADPDPTELQLEHPALAACYDAAALGVAVSGERAGQPNLRLLTTDTEQRAAPDALPDEPVALVRGINLYGNAWNDYIAIPAMMGLYDQMACDYGLR